MEELLWTVERRGREVKERKAGEDLMNGGTGRSKVILMGIASKIQMILGALIAAFFGLGFIGCLSQKTEVSVTIAILLFWPLAFGSF